MTYRSPQICGMLWGLCSGFVWNIFVFPKMFLVLKSQKMPNHTNAWNHQTATIKQKKIGKYMTMQETQPCSLAEPSDLQLWQNTSFGTVWNLKVFLFENDWCVSCRQHHRVRLSLFPSLHCKGASKRNFFIHVWNSAESTWIRLVSH